MNETVKKARIFNSETNSLSELVFVPYDPKIGEIYTTIQGNAIIYQFQPNGQVTQ